MTSRETETHCMGSYSSHKGSFKNPILVPNELNSIVHIDKLYSSRLIKIDMKGKFLPYYLQESNEVKEVQSIS